MKSLRSRFERQKFSEVFNYHEPSPVLVECPVEDEGYIKKVVTEKPYTKPKEVNYAAYTAAKVYEMGDVTPISLYNNMSSTERLAYVQKFENDIDKAMSNVISE